MSEPVMKKYELAFASGVVRIEVRECDFPNRKDLAAAVRMGLVIRAVVVEHSRQHNRRSAQYINLRLVERIL